MDTASCFECGAEVEMRPVPTFRPDGSEVGPDQATRVMFDAGSLDEWHECYLRAQAEPLLSDEEVERIRALMLEGRWNT